MNSINIHRFRPLNISNRHLQIQKKLNSGKPDLYAPNKEDYPAEKMSCPNNKSSVIIKSETVIPQVQNKGTGAGGANTNVNGKTFEHKTENESRLLSTGFVRKTIPGCNTKYGFYLIKEISPTESITYLTQGGLKAYFAHFFNKEMCRSPDEAYLFKNGDSYTLKILEKKNHNTPGSVDTKLLAGKGFIDEYEFILGEKFNVRYAFCISAFLKKDYIADCVKSKALRHINEKYGIVVLFGDDDNYYETLDTWISS
jgi:hypothetical protein